jgi:hypothetical protein
MDLTVEDYAKAKKLPLDFLKKLGLRNASWRGNPVVVIPYGDISGEEACVRIRGAMKGKDRFFWRKRDKPILYGLWRKKGRQSKYLVLSEGESDAQSLWLHGFPALGLPGANSWKEEWAQYFDSYEQIYAVVEPDQGGDAVLKSLGNSRIRDRVWLVRLDGVKDASELYLSDPRNFKQNWDTAMKAAVPWSETGEEEQQPRRTQTTLLLTLAEAADLFHTPDGEPFASVPVDDHRENWAIRSRHFRQWLLRAYYLETKSAPQSQAIQEATNVLESRANFGSPECPVFVRLAESDGKVHLDLCNERWEVVEVDAAGWRLLSNAPVKFRRARGMTPVPLPISGGSVDQLRPFVNVATDTDWILLVSWLMAAFRGRGPFPILVEHGEQGSAKSTTVRVLRALVDPSTASLRSEPREARDLAIAAQNGWVISLDNISRIPAWLSDALCRLSTGGAFGTRELYSDSNEVLFDAQRPIVLNGIEELAVRGDLLDRSLILYLPSIPEEKRRAELSFWSEFESSRPAILGALLDAVSGALRRLPKVNLPEMPRMADFAMWATAAEPFLGWRDGAFLRAYTRNQASSNELALDASPMSEPVRRLVAKNDFQGTATELLQVLTERSDDPTRRQKGWPANAQALSNTLRRLAPNLRKIGIEVAFSKGKDRRRRRLIVLRDIASTSSDASGERSPQ